MSLENNHFTICDRKAATNIPTNAPLDNFSPRPHSKSIIKRKNAVTRNFDKKNFKNRPIYWYQSLDSFNDYLSACDADGNSFPTTKRYAYTNRRTPTKLTLHKTCDGDYEFYDRVRPEDYLPSVKKKGSVEQFIQLTNAEFVTFNLTVEGSRVAIAICALGSRQISYIVPAAEKSKHSFGSLLLLEIIKWSCENNFSGIDAMVSKGVNGYKRKFFHDSYEVSRLRF